MIKSKQLERYCKSMFLKFTINNQCIEIDSKLYLIIDSDEILFNSEFEFLPKLDEGYMDGAVYEFCGNWYIQEIGNEVSLTPLKYIGESSQKIETNHFLGIHSGNELLNGVGLYSDWINKAKFLGIKSLGICEKNNVGGSLEFQKLCLKNNIKPIIGLSIDIKRGNSIYSVKCYCENFIGWQNLLKFTFKLNVESETSIDEDFLIENNEGLKIIIDPKESEFSNFENVSNFYQLDTVVFEEESKDIIYLNNLKKFIKSNMKPILICDAYYIEKEDWKVREKLWGIAKSYDYKTKNQHFKTNDEYATELLKMFVKGNSSWIKLFKEAESNLNELVEQCDFEYDTTSRHLPKYVMTDDESKLFSTNEQLFMHLIKEGFKSRKIKDAQKYIDRLKEEIKVLQDGDVIDYFLVLHDIIKFANKENILVGIGRGSAGGSLVSYLLGIIQINPIEFDLLFARFLNTGRMGTLTECGAYLIQTNDGNIKLNEKSVLKVIRNKKEFNIFVEDLVEGDEIIKY